jgi:repressor LexA
MSNVLLNMSSLTTRQHEVLAFIEESQATRGVVPSTREIQQHFGFASQTAAVNHLKALQRKGIIQRLAGKARAVALVSQLQREPILDIPLYGTIPAGFPVGAEQEDLGTVSIDAVSAGIEKGRPVFALRVRGDSMIGAQISDGDLAVLEVKEPRPGDIVAALIDGETTLKRFVVEGNQPYLKAENPNYPDLIPTEELVVQGVVVSLIRRYRG